jgi:hypothetical protein
MMTAANVSIVHADNAMVRMSHHDTTNEVLLEGSDSWRSGGLTTMAMDGACVGVELGVGVGATVGSDDGVAVGVSVRGADGVVVSTDVGDTEG